MMVENNNSRYKTAFTSSIEAAKNVSTAVSAKDRITNIRTAIKDNVKPSDLNKPGHVFLLCAQSGGIFAREGHT